MPLDRYEAKYGSGLSSTIRRRDPATGDRPSRRRFNPQISADVRMTPDRAEDLA